MNLHRGNPAITRRYPHVLGSDIVGRIVQSHSNRFSSGELVFTSANQYGTIKKGLFRTSVNILDTDLYSLEAYDDSPKVFASLGTPGLTAGKAIMIAFGKDILQKRANSAPEFFLSAVTRESAFGSIFSFVV